ncbi:MAG: YggS family pyridoxal phosphate-dependent enzyme [Pseudotabrizicola sp.]|uniref:YggS family pyridoxal phosphate-dependent enzyme n=1 Tax=Pseudotabrizicola sp. TaxID=2939647 RepID=UPI002717A789|nr:YggS family pyridoxal phosphate-dependent enzyme [Pseudotabrizicola sp.]MDO8883532.1 YggS family pyridoxal phosphate-dependent enzyme [Pseudotabrizicola sp.]MDP2082446.1 YggS family pyridoxal phosphate-dependent enzyme [Pseudotabrizicola sp.]MDZ7574199.1 YggS family pyridoxal phosphate-dependent enzyme [Pseudotabrizicola sp.]
MSLAAIQSRLTTACAAQNRAPGSVQLIAVSKVQPLDRVVDVLEQGHRLFGENYVQEAQAKWPDLRARFGAVQVHMIGPLQTNKAKLAVELFDAIHTLDRMSLAEKLAKLAQTRAASPQLFVQVNTGAEPQKAGILPDDTDAFVAQCRAMDLPVQGLMCIPPEAEDAAPHFKLLAQIAARNDLSGLSMGMSSDFETAIAHGATHIRVGSAIFGARTYG